MRVHVGMRVSACMRVRVCVVCVHARVCRGAPGGWCVSLGVGGCMVVLVMVVGVMWVVGGLVWNGGGGDGMLRRANFPLHGNKECRAPAFP